MGELEDKEYEHKEDKGHGEDKKVVQLEDWRMRRKERRRSVLLCVYFKSKTL